MIVEIRAGAGGQDSKLLTQDLTSYYQKIMERL